MRRASAPRVGVSPLLALALLEAATAARPQEQIEQKERWVVTNRQTNAYEQIYGEVRYMSLEAILNETLTIHGAVWTRGILLVGPKPETKGRGTESGGSSGQAGPPSSPGRPSSPTGLPPESAAAPVRQYALTLPSGRLTSGTKRGLPIQPGSIIKEPFEFEVDTLNGREVEVIGTFEDPVGDDRGGPKGGFWFWSYAVAPSRGPQSARTGLLAVEDLVTQADSVVGEMVKVQGQFRGRNLFGDLENAASPPDGWVIRDGAYSIWVYGRRPRGEGWSLDPSSRSDARKWVQVTGRLDRSGGVLRLKAMEVSLVPRPPTAAVTP
jgi:hypothetical protein